MKLANVPAFLPAVPVPAEPLRERLLYERQEAGTAVLGSGLLRYDSAAGTWEQRD